MVVKSSSNEMPPLQLNKVALLCVDLQNFCASPGFGGFKDLNEDNWRVSEFAYYFERIREKVVPNVRKLQEIFREKGLEIIHLRIQSLTKDGRDRSAEHKRLGSHVLPGSKEAEFLPEIAPVGDEIVISKTASGAFNSTNIDYLLRNLGIEQLVITGVETSECVETAVRDAADRGYMVYVPEDATAALNEMAQSASITAMNETYAYICSTEELCRALERL